MDRECRVTKSHTGGATTMSLEEGIGWKRRRQVCPGIDGGDEIIFVFYVAIHEGLTQT